MATSTREVYAVEVIRAIASRHGLEGDLELMPDSGMVNEAWLMGGDYVLRIIREQEADEEAERESLVVPLVRAAGVRSPDLIAANLERDIIPRPYTIYERAKGELLGHLTDDPALFGVLYRELGREIALINSISLPEGETSLRDGSLFDAPEQVAKALAAQKISEVEAKEIRQRLDDLEADFGEKPEPALLHRDLHPWNMFADPDTRELTAIIDWGDAAWGDPAIEFASMPLVALPNMFEGYKEAGGGVDRHLIARSVHRGIGLALWELRDLDPRRFARQWWRMSPGGWDEVWRTVDRLMA